MTDESAPAGRAVARSAGRPHAPPPAPAGARTVRVMCVDDHAVLIEGLRAQLALEGGFDLVASLGSAERLLEEVDRHRPDAVLLDIEMPGPDVFEMADRLHRLHPGLPFIFLSAHVRDAFLSAAYRCGASGYFAKGDDLEEIVQGLRQVSRGGSAFVMGAKVRARCAPSPAPEPTGMHRRTRAATGSTRLDALTPREMEVLRLIGKGRSRTEIAAELSRSAKTVDGHQERIMKKLGIDSRAELMRFAIREGLAEA